MTKPPNLDSLLARLESGESLEIEFKAAVGGLPKSLWETVSSFANTAGGWILLGVAESGGTFKVHGVKNAPALVQDIANILRNEEKISREACGPKDVTIETVGDAQLIVMRVRAASSHEKPVYLNKNPYEGTYVRRNEGDYHCSKQEVDRSQSVKPRRRRARRTCSPSGRGRTPRSSVTPKQPSSCGSFWRTQSACFGNWRLAPSVSYKVGEISPLLPAAAFMGSG